MVRECENGGFLDGLRTIREYFEGFFFCVIGMEEKMEYEDSAFGCKCV